jgi:hypothetical protein
MVRPNDPESILELAPGEKKFFTGCRVRRLLNGGYSVRFPDGVLAWYRLADDAIHAVIEGYPVPPAHKPSTQMDLGSGSFDLPDFMILKGKT